MIQEPGHNFGMQHSSSMDCGSASFHDTPQGNCTHSEYGDPFDPMGGGCRHMNAWQKAYQGWSQGCNMVRVQSSGTFTLLPLELRLRRRPGPADPDAQDAHVHALGRRRKRRPTTAHALLPRAAHEARLRRRSLTTSVHVRVVRRLPGTRPRRACTPGFSTWTRAHAAPSTAWLAGGRRSTTRAAASASRYGADAEPRRRSTSPIDPAAAVPPASDTRRLHRARAWDRLHAGSDAGGTGGAAVRAAPAAAGRRGAGGRGGTAAAGGAGAAGGSTGGAAGRGGTTGTGGAAAAAVRPERAAGRGPRNGWNATGTGGTTGTGGNATGTGGTTGTGGAVTGAGGAAGAPERRARASS